VRRQTEGKRERKEKGENDEEEEDEEEQKQNYPLFVGCVSVPMAFRPSQYACCKCYHRGIADGRAA
jgi:hypothetical protein